ncbi:uncharacterized protein LOC143445887 [Clavelina lepadiformis]|uniref:Uncharacterized protein n=1 Tax=Clavelina lepadiformis TaxID=159417 RepID=A0ABP0FH53_CLALP
MQGITLLSVMAVVFLAVVKSSKIENEAIMAKLNDHLDQLLSFRANIHHVEDLDQLILQHPEILSEYEIKNVTGSQMNYDQGEGQRTKRSAQSKCPMLTENYLKGKRYPQHRSTSPWKWIRNFDNERIPQWLVETKCLCNGCVDPFSRTENLDLRSVPITIDRHVKKKRNGKYVDDVVTLNMGCRCDFST